MERGGVPRTAAATGGIRRVLSLALLTAALATACGNSGTGGPRSATVTTGTGAGHTGSSRPSPTPASDAELCVRVVAHWSREVLDGGTYGDYQSMGLSNRQYDILREVVDAARPVRREQGDRAADELIDRRTRARCAERYSGGGASRGPWR
ncbi:hypothetical protein [Streptomyces flaveolus]|uniref:hypothetical protein n=1 Tax=Streptomyces flaveolus TaxID=67297 RepID=UPI0016705A87|nr:hypothetical protein [Streptomyces flaveolus]GGQ47959.1 hypothetical protein GCM10010216_05540 [Streptomyces flaveolus]